MQRDISVDALERFFRSTAVPMTLASATGPDCPLVLANDAFLDLTGYRREDVIGRNCRFLQGRDTDPRARAKLREAVATGVEVLVPITNYRKNGSAFENYVFLVPIVSGSGQLQYVMGSQYDITAPRRLVSLQEQARILDEHLQSSTGRSRAVGSLLRFRAEGRGG